MASRYAQMMGGVSSDNDNYSNGCAAIDRNANPATRIGINHHYEFG